MANISIGFGVVLILLGAAGYVVSDPKSLTALIPAFFGIALLGLGLLARNEKLRKHALHAAAMIGLVGFLVPGFMAARTAMKSLSGGEIERPTAFAFQALMAVACAVFVGLCVRSFLQARRSRTQRPAGTPS